MEDYTIEGEVIEDEDNKFIPVLKFVGEPRNDRATASQDIKNMKKHIVSSMHEYTLEEQLEYSKELLKAYHGTKESTS